MASQKTSVAIAILFLIHAVSATLPPVWDTPLASEEFSIDENSPINTVVVTLNATDPDTTTVSYTLTSAGGGPFAIVGDELQVNAATLDYESTTTYTLTVRATDLNTETTDVTFKVNVNDLNDNAPSLTGTTVDLTKDEELSLGTTVPWTFNVTDQDTVGTQTYSLLGADSAHFLIDPSAGTITLNDVIDLETTGTASVYKPVLQVDDGVASATVTLTLTISDINDNTPSCTPMVEHVSAVEETSDNTTALQSLTCTDADVSPPNNDLIYTIVSGDTSKFSIPVNTVADIFLSNAIDYETPTSSETLKIRVEDQGTSALSTTVTVVVTITATNDNDPAWDTWAPPPNGTYTYFIDEDTAIGTTIFTMSATDADVDTGSTLTYSIDSVTDGTNSVTGVFIVDSSSGSVTTLTTLDRDNGISEYILNVTASDGGASPATATVTVSLNDVNDNAPVFSSTPYAVQVVAETAALAGSIVKTVSATDADVTASTFTYSVAAVVSGSIGVANWEFDAGVAGQLNFNNTIDLDTAGSNINVLRLIVTDGGSPELTGTATLTVSITDDNEHTPAFTPSATYTAATLAENAASGTFVEQVNATDADIGIQGTVRYSIVGGDPQSQFSVNETTGEIEVANSLDRETTASYSLTVRATDDTPGATTAKSADATVSITISDINDNIPVFNPSTYTADVSETAVSGPTAVIVTVTVTDADDGVNAATTVSITSGNGEAKFNVSGNDLILAANLDYETTTSYILNLEATDGGTPALTGSAQVTINVLPANEEAPLMSASTDSASIPENTAVGILVYNANATDSDSGTHGLITYSVASGVPGSEFIIDSSNGKLYVGSALDYDVSPTSYTIVINATDGGGLSDVSTSTIALTVTLTDVNDNYPQFALSMATFSVDEGSSTGTTVGNVTVTDLDTGVNGVLTYTKLAGNGLTLFDIDSSTAELTTAAAIDYETSQEYFLTITAHDGGTPSLTSTGLVKVSVNNMNDNDPVITPVDFAVSVSESAGTGTSVLQYTGTDLDTNIDGYSLGVADTYFQISATGEVSTKAALDRETVAVHTLTIHLLDLPTSGDTTVRTSTATLTVSVEDVNDNDPVISGTYSQSVSEDAILNFPVFSIIASDADAGANAQLNYSISETVPFSIDSFGNVQVSGALDRETTASYTLTIVVTDQGTPQRSDQVSATVTISDINDNDPVASPDSYNMTIQENSSAGASVGTITASDADTGTNAALVYSLDSFSQGNITHFSIDASTGVITVAFSNTLDAETQDTYVGKVKIVDSGSPSRTATADINISITDLNDNPPVFSGQPYTDNIDENSAAGTSVLQPTTTDADAGVNGDITFTMNTALLDGPTANVFLQVDNSTGEVSVKSPIDYETHQNFTFVLVATDGGATPLSATATVTVSINDLNDNDPIFSPTFYNAEIAYNGLCTVFITQVSATDADSGSNGQISYSLVPGLNDHSFSVDATTGTMNLVPPVAANQRFIESVLATDAGSPARTSSPTATVRVDSFNPDKVILSFRLTISRADFLAAQATFLANIQTVVRATYPTALVRLWCLEEYEGTALPPYSRRRLLATSPVDAHVYALQTDTSESVANVNVDKNFVDQGTFFSMVAANAQGDPGTSITGASWDYYGIVSVGQYEEDTITWWETRYGLPITITAAALGVVWLGLLGFLVARTLYRRKVTPEGKMNTSNKAKLTKMPKKSPEQANTEQPKVQNKNSDAYRATTQDPLTNGDRAAFNPIINTDPVTNNNPASQGSTRDPRSVLLTPRQGYNNIINRQFDGTAFDPATGKMYEYNTRTHERKWM